MEFAATQLELMANKILPFLLTSSLQVSLFLALIFIISFLFKKQSAKFLYILWSIGLLKVLIPTKITLPDFFSAPELGINKVVQLPEISANVVHFVNITYRGYLLLFWMLGVSLLIIFWMYKNIQFNRIVRSCQPLDKQLFKELKIKIHVGSQIKSPFTKGIIAPKIFLPENALTLPEEELKAVILHEWAHIKRKDTFFIVIQNLIQTVYFFHPLVWFANVQVSRYREKACDDLAILMMNSKPLEYSKYLVNSLNQFVQWQPIPLMSNYFHQSKKFIFNRFEYIINRKENMMIKLSLVQKLVVVALLVVAVAFSCQKNDTEDVTRTTADESVAPGIAKNAMFVSYDTPPKPVGGFPAIQKNLIYPEPARKSGIEGKVVVQLHIDENGEIDETKILESVGTGCDEAAIDALKSVEWEPARDKNKPVAVWISVPVVFKLNGGESKPPALDKDKFVKFDIPPKPIGGFGEIQKYLEYPEQARKAGLEGKVVLELNIDRNGNVLETIIVESLGSGCDEAAIQAIKKVEWEPAKKDDKPVAVWIAIPLVFKLDSDKS